MSMTMFTWAPIIRLIFRSRCLHELLIEYSIHIPVTEHSLINDSWDTRPPHVTCPIFSQDLTRNQKSNNNTTVEHVATISPFKFLFSNFPKTSCQKREYESSSSLTAVNYVSLLQNAVKTLIGWHSAIKVLYVYNNTTKTGILHVVLIQLLLTPTMTFFGVRLSENAVYITVLFRVLT